MTKRIGHAFARENVVGRHQIALQGIEVRHFRDSSDRIFIRSPYELPSIARAEALER
jgi:hypothetical protein